MLHWPIYDIRVRTSRLELRLPSLELLDQMANLVAQGIHPPESMPFFFPWTDRPSPQREWEAVQWHLLQIGQWSPLAWSFNPVVLVDGMVVGTQGISAAKFAVTRSFTTGSWLGRAHQGQGLGREMRAAILHFGFVGLGAQLANSGAFRDNPASIAISHSLGYEENGAAVLERRGQPAENISFRLTRERWEQLDRPEVELEGLDGCLDLFGL
jgi:RimJ/RimL family protein N-acetyltransferase